VLQVGTATSCIQQLALCGLLLQVGIATIASAMQRAGGSLAHPNAALDEALEQRAAFIEGGAGPEASSLGAGACKLLPSPALAHTPLEHAL
jgi:hypothetical protein